MDDWRPSRRSRNPALRLTLRVSAMINTRHGIPVFTGNDRSSRHPKACSPGGMRATCGGVSRAAKGADCKSAGLRLRRFESYLPHHRRKTSLILFCFFQGATVFPARCDNRSSLIVQFVHRFGGEPLAISGLDIAQCHARSGPAKNCVHLRYGCAVFSAACRCDLA